MRVIYRSASKRQLTPSSTSLTQEALFRFRIHIQWVFNHLGGIRSSFCRFLSCSLAWVAVSLCILPWIGSLTIAYVLWKKIAVPWLFRRLALPQDLPENAPNINGINSGLHYTLVKVEGPPNLKRIKKQISKLLNCCSDPNGWKLQRRLIQLPCGMWAWRKVENFRVQNHITLCDEVWRGSPINNQSLKYRVNELCGVILDNQFSPWHIFVVPFVQKDTRQDCFALLLRAHHLLQHLFNVEEFGQHDPEEIVLRNALSEALSVNENSKKPNIRSATTKYNFKKQELIEFKKKCMYALSLIWQAPVMLLHEVLCSIHLFTKSRIFTGGKSKRALCWSDPISKDLINRLKESSCAESTESVLLSCFSGAMHLYQQISGSPCSDTTRSLFCLREGLVRVFLPVKEYCPKVRLQLVQRSLFRGIADDMYSLSQILLPVCYKFLPSCITSFLLDIMVLRYPILVNTVNLTASDSSIVEANHWNTQQFDFGLTVTLVERGEHVSVCVMSDFEILQRPDVLMSCFGRALLDLALAFNVRYERKPSPPSTPTKIFRSF